MKTCPICFDKYLPEDRRKPLRLSALLTSRLVAPVRKQWISGSILRVRFMGGTPAQHAIVKKEAAWWEACANIRFDFNNASDAEIRITFDQNDGAWSYIGTDCASIPLNEPTMNLGFLDEGTAAHEFGHALGLGHEHQNPEGGIEWNEQAVIRDLAGPPNYWDRDTVYHNVLRKYSFDQIKGTKFDPLSIMLYWFPKDWSTNGIECQQNNKLSEMDRSFMGSNAMYPKPSPVTGPVALAKRLVPNHRRRTEASIRKPGEEDLFVFTLGPTPTSAWRVTVNTRGETNVAMRLFGPNSLTSLIAEDDDSGIDKNAQIITDLLPGEYYIQVRHSDATLGVGRYSVKCSAKVLI